MQDLCSGAIGLDTFRGVAFVGGFSYADVLGSAKGGRQASTHGLPRPFPGRCLSSLLDRELASLLPSPGRESTLTLGRLPAQGLWLTDMRCGSAGWHVTQPKGTTQRQQIVLLESRLGTARSLFSREAKNPDFFFLSSK